MDIRKRGATSQIVRVIILDSTSTTGAGCTGLAYDSTNLVISFIRESSRTSVVYSGSDIEDVAVIGTYQAPSSASKCRFKAVDETNFPGLYEIHVHDDAVIFTEADSSASPSISASVSASASASVSASASAS